CPITRVRRGVVGQRPRNCGRQARYTALAAQLWVKRELWGKAGGGGPLVGSGRAADQGFAMTSAPFDRQATATGEQYRALLAVSEAIASHRDLPALFHELAGRLHLVVRFANLALLLHEA